MTTRKMEFPTPNERHMTLARVLELLDYSEELGQFTWKVGRNQNVLAGSIAGGDHVAGYLRIMIDGRYFLVHRMVWLVTHGEWPDCALDHINRVRNDNRIGNIRKATQSQNSQNRGMRADNTSGHKGVTWSPKYNKWCAQIWYDKRNHFLGHFVSKDEASKAYRAAAKTHHEFFPESHCVA